MASVDRKTPEPAVLARDVADIERDGVDARTRVFLRRAPVFASTTLPRDTVSRRRLGRSGAFTDARSNARADGSFAGYQ